MNENNKKNGKKVLFSYALLSISFISCLVLLYFAIDNPTILTFKTISLTALLILIALSLTFDKLSVGKFLSVSRKLESVELKQKEIAQEQMTLRNEVLSIVSQQISVNQKMTQNQQAISSPTIYNNVMTQPYSEKDKKENEKEISTEDKKKLEVMLNIEPKKHRWWDIFDTMIAKIEKPLVEEVCKQRQYNLSGLHFNQKIIVSGDLNKDPLLHIMYALFNGLIYTQLKDIFFVVIHSNRSNEDIFNMVFKYLSILQKYQEIKNKNFGLILIINPFMIKNDRAEAIRKYLYKNFEPFMSSSLLEFEVIPVEKIQEIIKEKNITGTKKET